MGPSDLFAVSCDAQELLDAAPAVSSAASRRSAWSWWSRFCLEHDLNAYIGPAKIGSDIWLRQDVQLIEFVNAMFRRGHPHSTIQTYISSLAYLLKEHWGQPIICNYTRYKTALRGTNKLQAAAGIHPKKMKPITMQMLADHLIVLRFWTLDGSRMAAIISLGICFGLRSSVLFPSRKSNHHLRRRDVFFYYNTSGRPIRLKIRIRSSKGVLHPAFRETVANGSSTCTVALLHYYLSLTHLSLDTPLFSPFTGINLLRTVRAMGASIGSNPKRYGTQSLRKGAATELCSGGFIPAYLIKKQLRWKSDVYEDVYQYITTESLDLMSSQLAAEPRFGHPFHNPALQHARQSTLGTTPTEIGEFSF